MTLMTCGPDAAAGVKAPAGRAALLLAGVADCATAGVDTANAAASTHDAHDAKNTPRERNAELDTERGADTSEADEERGKPGDEPGDKNSGKCDKRETKREPRQLRDKEIGNVVEGQRNMPEILSPCG
ncbi:hypothetical protein [Paraburkholderia dipogonis]|uniref:hypothetical protein n=1 Tax=Paraburkholderia dipogonis TaxID=1211383 RepID=UPI0038BA5847